MNESKRTRAFSELFERLAQRLGVLIRWTKMAAPMHRGLPDVSLYVQRTTDYDGVEYGPHVWLEFKVNGRWPSAPQLAWMLACQRRQEPCLLVQLGATRGASRLLRLCARAFDKPVQAMACPSKAFEILVEGSWETVAQFLLTVTHYDRTSTRKSG